MRKNKMPSTLFLIGFFLIVIGFFFILISAFSQRKVEFAAGGFVGPIPFGFFTSSQIFFVWLVLFVALVIVWFLLFRLGG